LALEIKIPDNGSCRDFHVKRSQSEIQ